MPSTNTGPWKMPEELKPYEPFFRDLGACSVEALMNTYGAKCALRLAKAGENPNDPAALDLRALLCNAQVELLVALKGAGLLREQAPGSPEQGEKEASRGNVR